MGVELVDEKNPTGRRIRLDRPLNMAGKIRLGSGGADRWGEDLPRGYDEVGDQGLGPMPQIFKFRPLDEAGAHGAGGLEPFEGLDARLLIRAQQLDAVGLEQRGLLVELTHRADRGVKFLGRVRPVIVEPIPALMRF